jgi:hypothetical protein
MRITVEIATPSMAIVGQPIQIAVTARHVGSCGSAGLFLFTLQNAGDPVFSLSSQESPTGLAPGNSKTVTFTLIPTQAGTAQLGVLLSYEASLLQSDGNTLFVWQNSTTTQSVPVIVSPAATATPTATPTATIESPTASPTMTATSTIAPTPSETPNI